MRKQLYCITLFLVSMLVTSIAFAQDSKCLIVGHRGSSKIAPENTAAAANLAWSQGADAVEIDVHLTADNKIVAIHDKNTKRTAGVNHVVSETPYATLKELDVGSWKGQTYKGEPIPLLEDIVSMIPKGRMERSYLRKQTRFLHIFRKIMTGLFISRLMRSFMKNTMSPFVLP